LFSYESPAAHRSHYKPLKPRLVDYR
jgi:hypothetical protein